jgi:hypothetical protein
MSIPVDPAGETISQRNTRVSRAFGEALGLGNLTAKDVTLLTIALIEVATRRAGSDRAFAAQVRRTFGELAACPPVARKPKKPEAFAALALIGPIDLSRLRPHGALDPFALYEAYGDVQAEQVLKDLTLDDLKASAGIVEQRHPGTKPTSRRARSPLIIYIMESLRNGRRRSSS